MDPWILETVSRYHLELCSTPYQAERPRELDLSKEKSQALAEELKALKQKRAIDQIKDQEGSFISPMFQVPKGEGAWRPIIDLRELNQFVIPHHFKMEESEQ